MNRFRVVTFGTDRLGNCTGWFVEDTHLPRTQLTDQRISELFIEPEQRRRARERAYALADKLERAHRAASRQLWLTQIGDENVLSANPRLTAEDWDILMSRFPWPRVNGTIDLLPYLENLNA